MKDGVFAKLVKQAAGIARSGGAAWAKALAAAKAKASRAMAKALDPSLDDAALFVAAHLGEMEKAKDLLELGAKCQGPMGSALSEAAKRGDHEMAKLLLASGSADLSARDKAGFIPLMHAAVAGDARCVELLLPGSDLLAASNDGETALMMSASRGGAECLRLLLGKVDAKAKTTGGAPGGLDPDQARNCPGYTALMMATFGNPESLELLLPWSDPDAVNEQGCDALMVASISGSAWAVRMLAGRCSPKERVDRDGRRWAALDFAASSLGSEALACVQELAKPAGIEQAKRALEVASPAVRPWLAGRVLALSEQEELGVELSGSPGRKARAVRI